ncbi:hypothetical protein MRB53_040046 [Persea americana]|nr:hypothetical protein MRB53_040046 [Persea americana]
MSFIRSGEAAQSITTNIHLTTLKLELNSVLLRCRASCCSKTRYLMAISDHGIGIGPAHPLGSLTQQCSTYSVPVEVLAEQNFVRQHSTHMLLWLQSTFAVPWLLQSFNFATIITTVSPHCSAISFRDVMLVKHQLLVFG